MSSLNSEQLSMLLEQQRAAYRLERMPSLAVRKDRLRRIIAMTDSHALALADAMSQDFGHRSKHESLSADVLSVKGSAQHAIGNLQRWMRVRRTSGWFLPGGNRLMPQPLGVAGVVSPWNYPYLLAMAPAVGALAAGNRVMIKPSELTPATSELIRRMVAETFSPDEMSVVTGDADVARAFVELPFDHLFFTGSTGVGRSVAQAAAKNLTPVTLELGGKSPVLVDRSADLALTARRLAFAKLLNAGQTCVAPDYLLVPQEFVEPLAQGILANMRRMYPTVGDNPDFSSVVNAQHLARLQALIDDAQRAGARVLRSHDETSTGRKLAPTLLLDVRSDMAVMREEVFGPVLPIVSYHRAQDAIDFINSAERPLAMYWFGRDKAAQSHALAQTVAGGVTINDCIWHLGQEDLPFGGVGASGSGVYHGQWGFDTFSQLKPIFTQSRFPAVRFFYPPYGRVADAVVGLKGK